MLFPYKYVNHDIEKFHAWLDHLVKEVWCQAAEVFTIELLHPDLRAAILEIFNIEESKPRGKIKDWLHGPISDLFYKFKAIEPTQRQSIATWFDNNNDIRSLCNNEANAVPVTYADVQSINKELAESLKSFCSSLFNNVLSLEAVKSRTGDIDDHYRRFVNENRKGLCPFCGLNRIKGKDHRKREAYDHYLPKGTYPFNSINFRNLAPMCHECNSSYKLEKDPMWHLDPLHEADRPVRRKAFYAFDENPSGITIDLTLTSLDIDLLIPDDITLKVSAAGREKEVETWMQVFGIEERYKATFCSESEGKCWFVQALDECQNVGKTPDEILDKIEQNEKKRPWGDFNFFKKPFLGACRNAGLLSSS